MNFTEDEYHALVDTYFEDQTLLITGCNSFSQEFETSGKISTVLEDEWIEHAANPNELMVALSEDTLILEFGKKKENNLRPDYTASFVTDLYEDNMYNFVIKEIKIKKTGKTIYRNKDYEDIYAFFRSVLVQYGKTLLKNDITPGTMDGTCQKLSNYIGKPIDIYGNKGVLFFVDSTYKGEILLYYSDFTSLKEVKFPKNSTIVEGKNILKISAAKKHESFEDFLLNYNRKK